MPARVRPGWWHPPPDVGVSLFGFQEGYIVYVDGRDKTRGQVYDPNSLADQAKLIERLGEDQARRVIEWMLSN